MVLLDTETPPREVSRMLGQTHSRGTVAFHSFMDGCSSSFKVILYETSLNHFGALQIAHSSGSTEVIFDQRVLELEAEVQKLKNARANSLPLHNALYMAEFAFYNTARQLELRNPSLQIGEIDYLKEPFGQVVKGRIPEADGPLLLKRGLADPLRWSVPVNVGGGSFILPSPFEKVFKVKEIVDVVELVVVPPSAPS
ncbi:uncharacterized protein G2W53_014156 [Senna tora]|uniref:Uncharacterized protein n=1 Tax=Senna tora TaxID=362788 RepID=A0A834WT10_9FABA|nr:uncharacterized protein G2W53_014156 [Senna tora]